MSVTNGSIGARFHRTTGERCFSDGPAGISPPVQISGVFSVSRFPGRKRSPCAVYGGRADTLCACSNFSVQSAPPSASACASLLSFASGGSSSAVNSSLERSGSPQRLRLLSAPPVPPPVQPHENADSIGFRAGVSGLRVSALASLCAARRAELPEEQVRPGSCPESCRRASSEKGIRPERSWEENCCAVI